LRCFHVVCSSCECPFASLLLTSSAVAAPAQSTSRVKRGVYRRCGFQRRSWRRENTCPVPNRTSCTACVPTRHPSATCSAARRRRAARRRTSAACPSNPLRPRPCAVRTARGATSSCESGRSECIRGGGRAAGQGSSALAAISAASTAAHGRDRFNQLTGHCPINSPARMSGIGTSS
jgi:hypothetical protein